MIMKLKMDSIDELLRFGEEVNLKENPVFIGQNAQYSPDMKNVKIDGLITIQFSNNDESIIIYYVENFGFEPAFSTMLQGLQETSKEKINEWISTFRKEKYNVFHGCWTE